MTQKIAKVCQIIATKLTANKEDLPVNEELKHPPNSMMRCDATELMANEEDLPFNEELKAPTQFNVKSNKPECIHQLSVLSLHQRQRLTNSLDNKILGI